MNTASPVLPDISCHEAWFAAYAAREREKECRRDGGDPSPMDLKLHHTMQVLAHARAIVAGGRFAPPLDRACLLAALYHDVARFEQYLRWHTFRDRESCNHGQWGVRILKREQRLKDETPAVRQAGARRRGPAQPLCPARGPAGRDGPHLPCPCVMPTSWTSCVSWTSIFPARGPTAPPLS